jgi:hypothetical protein
MALLQFTCASIADSARFSTFFHRMRIFPVFCSSDFMVALNKGPSSVWLRSSPGRRTSTLTDALVSTVACVGTRLRLFSGMASNIGDLGGILSQSRFSSAESLTRESIDCAEGTRSLGGTPSSSRGVVLGLWRALFAVSVHVSFSSDMAFPTKTTKHTLYPKGKIGKSLQSVRPLIVLYKLHAVS